MFTSTPLVACWRYEPREHLRPLAIARAAIPPSPLRDRVGYSDHDRFRGYLSVHFIPAYNLPVYASQRPLPDTTQDSVRGCALGFAAAVIADGRLQRVCKAQPVQIPACAADAPGSSLGFWRRSGDKAAGVWLCASWSAVDCLMQTQALRARLTIRRSGPQVKKFGSKLTDVAVLLSHFVPLAMIKIKIGVKTVRGIAADLVKITDTIDALKPE